MVLSPVAEPGAIASLSAADAATLFVLVPDGSDSGGRSASAAILSELEAGLGGFTFALGRSRWCRDPRGLARAGDEAILALTVADGEPEPQLAFEATGTYQLLPPYVRDPAELWRFDDETVRPLVVYDEQDETDLLGVSAPSGPATERGAEGGRVPR